MDTKHTIFIVEDNELVARTLGLNIDSNPSYQAKIFLTGEDMLEHLHEKPTLVILDYHLNSIVKTARNGKEIFDEIDSRNPGLPVIMLSALDDRKELVNMLKAGINDFVVKDGDYWEDINRSVRETINLIDAEKKIEMLNSDIKTYKRRFLVIATVLILISILLVIVSIYR